MHAMVRMLYIKQNEIFNSNYLPIHLVYTASNVIAFEQNIRVTPNINFNGILDAQ